MTDFTITGNTATSYGGGGVYLFGGSPIVINGAISANRVTGSGSAGGGIFLNGGPVIVTNVLISGNSADSGGGIYTMVALSR